MNHEHFPHGDLTGRIIKSFLQTHIELGSGFSERVCQRALAIVLSEDGMDVALNVGLEVTFRGRRIGKFFADMVVNDVVLVEVKATPLIEASAIPQVLNYLKAAGGGVGMLLNFGKHADYKRLIMGDATNSLPQLHKHSTTPPREQDR